VLYAVSLFLAPSSNKTEEMKLLQSVEDVNEIKNIDWCSHVFSELVKAIEIAKNTPRATLKGCFLFLMVSWFQRFDYGQDQLSTDLPFIKHRTDDKLTQMIAKEMAAGKFGYAPFRKVIFPLSKNINQSTEVPFQAAVKRFLHIELPDDIMTDEEIEKEATDVSIFL